jgi:hypothetical protein
MSDMQTQSDYPKTATFETVWAALQETDRMIKENAREAVERHKELSKAQQEIAAAQKETDRQMKEYNKRFGDFTNRFGEIIERLVAPNMLENFRALGFDFERIYPNAQLSNKKLNLAFQIDILLENGDKAMLVEVKSALETKDVKKHIERLEKMRMYADARGDKRRFLGAVAGVVITPEAKESALEQGLFVIEPSGETFNITPPEGKPKEW